jgi:hypothetical protein
MLGEDSVHREGKESEGKIVKRPGRFSNFKVSSSTRPDKRKMTDKCDPLVMVCSMKTMIKVAVT